MRYFFALALAFLIASTSAAPLLSQLETRQDASSAETPCSRIDPKAPYYSPSVIRACLQSIPFSEDIRRNVMAAIEAMTTLSVFEYDQLGSEGSLAQNIDLQKEFARIKSASYTSDFDFQSDLSRLFRSLNDGHYYWTSCYDSLFSTYHYLPITAYRLTSNIANSDVDSNQNPDPSIYLVPNLATFVASNSLTEPYKQINLDPDQLAGAQVLQIEGRPVLEFLMNVTAADYGMYQDKAQRLNALLAGHNAVQGVFGQTSGGFTMTNYLDKDNFTMSVRLRSGEERLVVVPWLTYWSGEGELDFAGGQELFSAKCARSNNSFRKRQNEHLAEFEIYAATPIVDPLATIDNAISSSSIPSTLGELTRVAYTQCPSSTTPARYPYSNSPQSSPNYLGGRDIQFYTVPSSNVGVIYIPTFAPRNNYGSASTECTYRFVVDIFYGLQNLTNAGVKKILIDTSNNGGGSVSLNQLLQRFLTGEQYEVDINFETVLRRSPLSEAMLAAHLNKPDEPAGSFGPDRYRVGMTEQSDTASYFDPGREFTVNGQTLRTSNSIEDSLDDLNAIDKVLKLSQSAPFAPSDIVFTGNGLCGSACSSFTNFLIEHFNATAYISTVRPQDPIEFQAFAAGQAFNSDGLYAEASSIGFDDQSLLPHLNVVGTLGFALRGAVSPNIDPGTFLQYRPYPAQKTYTLTEGMYTNPMLNWGYVAKEVFG